MEQEPTCIDTLISAVGGLPLALTFIGNHLRLQAHSGQPRRIRAALTRLQDAHERFSLAEIHQNIGPASHVSSVPVSLETTLAESFQCVSEEARSALRALTLFPSKPESFSEDEAFDCCHISVEDLDVLSDAGLLESSMPGRYALHPIIADYARLQLM